MSLKSLKVRHGDIELKDNSKHYWGKLTVGMHDLVLVGKHKDAVRWLFDQNMPVRCAKGYGNAVHIILREQAPRLNETILGAVAGAFGVSPMSIISAGLPGLPFRGAIAELVGNEAESKIDGKIMDACSTKKVTVYISSAQGCFSRHGDYQGTVATLPSNINSRFVAGALAGLSP